MEYPGRLFGGTWQIIWVIFYHNGYATRAKWICNSCKMDLQLLHNGYSTTLIHCIRDICFLELSNSVLCIAAHHLPPSPLQLASVAAQS